MGISVLNTFLASLLGKFKTANPVIFVIVAALLSAVKYALDAGVFPIDAKVSEWILWVVALFLGTPTTKFLESTETK